MIVVVGRSMCAWKSFLKSKHLRRPILKRLKALRQSEAEENRVKKQVPRSSGKNGPGRTVGNFLDFISALFQQLLQHFLSDWALGFVPSSCSQSSQSMLGICRIYCFRILCFLFPWVCTCSATSALLSPGSAYTELSENSIFLTSGLARTWCCSEFSLNVVSVAEVAQLWEDELAFVVRCHWYDPLGARMFGNICEKITQMLKTLQEEPGI